jgi:hypothetical protein
VATAITSDEENNGYQTALIVKYDNQIADNLADIRAGGCCSIF